MNTSELDAAIEAAERADPLSAFVEAKPPEPEIKWPEGLPSPGIYKDISYDTYKSWPAINASGLKILMDASAKHCKAYMDGKLDKDTEDRRKGRAFHCALLEPNEYADRFPVSGTCCETLSSGKNKGKPCGNEGKFYEESTGSWYCGQHNKNHEEAIELPETISQAASADIKCMRIEVFRHKVVSLLRQHGGCEVSLIWEREGIPCKARLDKLIIDSNCPDTIVDLKKIQVMAGSDEKLQNQINNNDYDLSACWYVDGLRRLRPDKKKPLFAWIFAEDGYPYDVAPKWASKPTLEIGRMKADNAFHAFRTCYLNDRWPGYSEDITEITPPDWQMKRYGL